MQLSCFPFVPLWDLLQGLLPEVALNNRFYNHVMHLHQQVFLNEVLDHSIMILIELLCLLDLLNVGFAPVNSRQNKINLININKKLLKLLSNSQLFPAQISYLLLYHFYVLLLLFNQFLVFQYLQLCIIKFLQTAINLINEVLLVHSWFLVVCFLPVTDSLVRLLKTQIYLFDLINHLLFLLIVILKPEVNLLILRLKHVNLVLQ